MYKNTCICKSFENFCIFTYFYFFVNTTNEGKQCLNFLLLQPKWFYWTGSDIVELLQINVTNELDIFHISKDSLFLKCREGEGGRRAGGGEAEFIAVRCEYKNSVPWNTRQVLDAEQYPFGRFFLLHEGICNLLTCGYHGDNTAVVDRADTVHSGCRPRMRL